LLSMKLKEKIFETLRCWTLLQVQILSVLWAWWMAHLK